MRRGLPWLGDGLEAMKDLRPRAKGGSARQHPDVLKIELGNVLAAKGLSLIITVKLVKWAKRRDSMAVA